MRRSSRKCACRRELNSHEAAKPRIQVSTGGKMEVKRPTDVAVRSSRLISVRASASADQSEFTRTLPAASNWVQQRALGKGGSAGESRKHRLRSGVTLACEAEEIEEIEAKNMDLWSTLQGAERHARLVACAADAEYRDCSCRSAEREAECLANKLKTVGRRCKLMPNPSLKWTRNGRPPWPRLWYAVHFLSPGQGVLPLRAP